MSSHPQKTSLLTALPETRRSPISLLSSGRSLGTFVEAALGADRDAPLLLLAEDPSAVPNDLAPLGTFAPFSTLEGPQPDEAGGGAVLVAGAASPTPPEAALAAVYERCPAGAPLVYVDAPRGLTAQRRDALASALYRAGFVRPRFRAGPGGRLVALTHRGSAPPPTAREMTLSVVMPVYNERETFAKVLDELLAKEIPGIAIDVVIVESNSSDGTREAVLGYQSHPRVQLVLEDAPHGKGHAVRAGLAAAGGDFILIQDADMEYDIADYDALLEPLRAFRATFVLGYRLKTHGARFGVRHFEKQLAIGLLMNVGNALFLRLFNTVYRSRLRDPFTMYKVLRRDALEGLRLECNRFDFDWELTGKLLRCGYHPVEVPVSYHSRSFIEGKKVSILRDPLSWVVACFKYRVSALEEPLPEEPGR